MRRESARQSWKNKIVCVFNPSARRPYEIHKYRKFLLEEEKVVDAKIAANACPKAEPTDFTVFGAIGSGEFGVVLKAQHNRDGVTYAFKVLNKERSARLLDPLAPVKEKKIHAALDSDFIVKLVYAFQDKTNLYLVSEFAPYGDLCSQLEGSSADIPEPTIKFFAAQIVLALEYLHACKILHRDLKPENVMVFEDGCLKVGDVGRSKKVKERTSTFTGPIHYSAPEILLERPYGKSVDWWSFGILVFMMFYKMYAFTRFEWSDQDNTASVLGGALEFPPGRPISGEARDFIRCLLQRDVTCRLGALSGGIEDVKNHAWFDCDFIDIYHRRQHEMQINLIPVYVRPFKASAMFPKHPRPDVHRELYKEF